MLYFRGNGTVGEAATSGRCYDPTMASSNSAEPRVPLRFLFSGDAGSPIRRIVLLGFSAIFALWLISAYALGQRVLEADRRVAEITTKSTQGEGVLGAVRERVLLSSILVRDAVLENGANGVLSVREQLRTLRDDVERRLAEYQPFVDSAIEQEHWTHLRTELDEFWATLSPLLTEPVNGRTAQALLRGTLVAKRELVFRVSDDLRVLNQDALQEQQLAVTEIHRAVRQRLWWTSGLAVAFGFGVALLATKYIGRLESWIRQQHQQEREHKGELQRLSAELDDARESERRRIARDLHDEIGQALMTIKLDLGVVDRSGELSAPAAAALAEARASTESAIQTVRDLSQLLHPPMLDDFGLAATLQAYVRGFSGRTGVHADLVLDRMDVRVPSPIEVCAYRVIQEALTNVVKHARATSCRVYLHRLPYSLLVTVEDNGAGMAEAVEKSGDRRRGVGLVGLRERVSRAGGTLTVESSPGKGTRLTVELPVPTETTTAASGAPTPANAAAEG
jgi:signal transduction histidine kinase